MATIRRVMIRVENKEAKVKMNINRSLSWDEYKKRPVVVVGRGKLLLSTISRVNNKERERERASQLGSRGAVLVAAITSVCNQRDAAHPFILQKDKVTPQDRSPHV